MIFALLLSLFCSTAEALPSPADEIVIIENFISHDDANTLMRYYDSQNKALNRHTDNQLTFSSSTDPKIRNLITSISTEILRVMRERFSLGKKNYQIDHCALYARIAGNYCPYHADNILFSCPIHGNDQEKLRTTCNGSCPGAKYLPNHTGWREYTALLYLNDQFTGGEIAFEDGPHNTKYRKVIPIKANLLVITPNGPNFYHEVYPIRSGQRYSLHFWYTSDSGHFNSLLTKK